jgi:uncharacterized protein YcnI
MARSGLVVTALGGAVAVLLFAAPAGAAVTVAPGVVDANATATIGFTVNFGCGMWPTTDLKIHTPAAVTAPRGVDKPGWVTNTTGSTIEFSDGLLDSQTADTFEIAFTVPDQPGTVLTFPVEQTCIDGETVDWNAGPHDGPSANVAPNLMIEPPSRAPKVPATSAAVPVSTGRGSNGHMVYFAVVPAVVPIVAAGWWLTRNRTRAARPTEPVVTTDPTKDKADDRHQREV